ncbi:hypothetical protein [Sphingopyxis sp.]|uniref:hypothetical protein n=1 Tax=Sphingopyxis sp. TaxID=1908224 RepID=UPI003D0AE4BF
MKMLDVRNGVESGSSGDYIDMMTNRRRELLSTAFEDSSGRWVWYANAWSHGIVVSAEEREIYLAFNPIGFRRAIKGRQATEPTRPYWQTLQRLLSATFLGRDPASRQG